MSNMVVNTNVPALNSHRAMKNVGVQQFRASQRLSSGLRINVAADDAAGLAISEKMRAQIRGLDQASRNAQDGISMVQTAEGGMTEIGSMVRRIRDLTVQLANDSNTPSDRSMADEEVIQLFDAMTAMANQTQFNERYMLNGSTSMIFLQTGANAHEGFSFTLTDILAYVSALRSIYVMSGVTVTATPETTTLVTVPTGTTTMTAVTVPATYTLVDGVFAPRRGSVISALLADVSTTLNQLNATRAKYGAIQNRLEFTVRSIDISSENLSAAESRIRDADMAQEMMNFTKANVLQQAATSMLAQANQSPMNILQLLR